MAKSARQEKKELKPSETNEIILLAHFERFTIGNMKKIVSDWSKNDKDQDGKKKAILFLFKSINDDFEEFREFLDESFKEKNISYITFQTFARHATGNLIDEDPILVQCSRLSSCSVVQLKKQIGNYFKEQSNNFLKENYREVLRDLNLLHDNEDVPSAVAQSAAGEVFDKKVKEK
ncbi:MAG TPA: hypothetical protein VI861_01985 [Rickettsiales bacterium]|nr:hypothetical protein [Rickettsiales bacterium]